MDWIQKKSFDDYLKDSLKKQQDSSLSSSDFVTPLYIDMPKVIFKKNPYPKSFVGIEERIAKYLFSKSEEWKFEWEKLQKIASFYSVPRLLPWDLERSYKSLAMKIHPDHNSSPNAHSDFISLTRIYRSLKKIG